VTEAAPSTPSSVRSSQVESRAKSGSVPCYLDCWTPCARIQCLNGGYCIQPSTPAAIAYCHCPSTYTGYRCEQQAATIDPCANHQCNQGTCHKDRNNQAYCSCFEGYGGPRCETQIDPCARVNCNHGRCELDRTAAVCRCYAGFSGSDCLTPLADPCLRYECYGGTCSNDRGVARCVCPVGRIGSRCQDDICALYPCANNGQCVPEGGSRRCICTNPYYGDDCREVYRPNPCDNVYCAFGQCREGICECHSGYTGAQCDVPPDLCANVNCNYGTCHQGHCSCSEGYTGTYCDTLIPTSTPALIVAATPSRPPLTAQTVGLIGPKTGQLIDYGRLLGARAGPIGWILALVSGLFLLPVALAFAARKCTQGGCIPMRPGGSDYIRVPVQPVAGAATSAGTETTRIEQTREHVIETDYHVPPVADFGYNRTGGVTEGYRDTFESWETAGAGGYSMNAMFADGGLQTDYELSNINSISMTPNGKYTIVGQSQGPPQIWDAINGQLVSSMQGTSVNCTKVALACNGTLLVGLASDGVDPQSNVLQLWDVNTGKPVQLTHTIKCATFTLSNDSNNLIMAGNQKYGRGISVGVLDLTNSELTKEIKSDTNQSYGGTPGFIALTPDERFAVVGCSSSNSPTTYVVFDLTTQQELVQPNTIVIDSDPRCSLVLNNEQIVTGTRNGQLFLWSIPTCQRIHSLNDNGQNAHRDRVTDLKISPERSCFVSTSADGTGKIWDTHSKELISRLVGHKREITCACISTNQLVATGSRDQNICLWRLQTGQIASTMPVSMTPLDIHMAAHNRTVVAIGDKDGERQLLMLRVVSVQR